MDGVNLLTRYYVGCGNYTKSPYEIEYYWEADSRSGSQKTFWLFWDTIKMAHYATWNNEMHTFQINTLV